MKFRVEADTFSKALSYMASVLPAKSTLPILRGMRITSNDNTITIKATDLSYSVVVTIPAEVKEQGDVVVSMDAKKINGINKLQDVLSFNIGTKCTIRSSGKQVTLSTFKAEEFPNGFITQKSNNSIVFDSIKLYHAIKIASSCISNDNARPVLTGYNFVYHKSHVNIITADGFRAALLKVPVVESGEFDIMSSLIEGDKLEKVISLLKDADEIYMLPLQNKVNFYAEKDIEDDTIKISYTIVTIAGEYPNVTPIFEDAFVKTNGDVTIWEDIDKMSDVLAGANIVEHISVNLFAGDNGFLIMRRGDSNGYDNNGYIAIMESNEITFIGDDSTIDTTYVNEWIEKILSGDIKDKAEDISVEQMLQNGVRVNYSYIRSITQSMSQAPLIPAIMWMKFTPGAESPIIISDTDDIETATSSVAIMPMTMVE